MIKRNQKLMRSGFSLVELLVVVGIVGILSSIAIPNYFKHVQKQRQADAAATLSQLQTSTMAYIDEYGREPSGWGDLSDIIPIQTPAGPINTSNFNEIILIGGQYKINKVPNKPGAPSSYYVYSATSATGNSQANDFNIFACIDTTNGASDLILGKSDFPESTANLKC